MSFADRFKTGVNRSNGGRLPLPGPAPPAYVPNGSISVKIATNDNNFVPTKYGQELPNAARYFLPRGSPSADIVIDVTNKVAFPSLGAAMQQQQAQPKTTSAMNNKKVQSSWAEMTRRNG